MPIPFPDLARDMHRMANLHPQSLWAVAMREGADAIEALLAENASLQFDAALSWDEGRKEGYQEGMQDRTKSDLEDVVVESAQEYCLAQDDHSRAGLARAVRALNELRDAEKK